ncbi:hypothetical protein BDA99DRAFT_65686 [Phascolomyces articulosus]|uniref:Uncharacterized protein n=1 Tax=Phascolomyces articulosus TaxID=60185 RepID=A0AAD5KA11_9FUNG|nr:hypothetical protein BDA99DRAFT_65686 [Phascolomyces articulosus]
MQPPMHRPPLQDPTKFQYGMAPPPPTSGMQSSGSFTSPPNAAMPPRTPMPTQPHQPGMRPPPPPGVRPPPPQQQPNMPYPRPIPQHNLNAGQTPQQQQQQQGLMTTTSPMNPPTTVSGDSLSSPMTNMNLQVRT